MTRILIRLCRNYSLKSGVYFNKKKPAGTIRRAFQFRNSSAGD
ncbi:hypothetical protein OHAE_3268 [Ochrobactrum soli]|uniref:Uncharacterized protein n=1 Tax=Ochrobactrum soli TaxID=2448455 RepID=A0A2P9HGZ0_9HYPH|nr:hypothetical protein OHAE_3268 [[Ochrobactrum] soli]